MLHCWLYGGNSPLKLFCFPHLWISWFHCLKCSDEALQGNLSSFSFLFFSNFQCIPCSIWMSPLPKKFSMFKMFLDNRNLSACDLCFIHDLQSDLWYFFFHLSIYLWLLLVWVFYLSVTDCWCLNLSCIEKLLEAAPWSFVFWMLLYLILIITCLLWNW